MSSRGFVLGCLLLAVAVPASGDATAVSTISEGYRLLGDGQVEEARAAFAAIACQHPDSKAAWQGLTWANLRAGDVDAAVEAADRCQQLDPGDDPWRRKRITIMLDAAGHRDRAVRELRELAAARPEDPETRFALGRALSLFVGDQQGAAENYRAGLRAHDDPDARLGLARALSWSGRGREAAVEYDRLLAADPEHVEALVGRARVAQWNGKLGLARTLNDRARAIVPDDPRPHLGLARIALQEDRPVAARRHAMHGREVVGRAEEDAPLFAAIDAASAPRARVFGTLRNEPLSGVERRSSGVLLTFRLPRDVEARLEGSYSRFQTDAQNLEFATAGLQLRHPLPGGVQFGGFYRNHRFPEYRQDAPFHAWGVEAKARLPGPPTSIRIGFRNRLLVEEPVDESPVAPFYEAGTGGMIIGAIRQQVALDEWHAALSGAPLRGSFIYLVGSIGQVDDAGDDAVLDISPGTNDRITAVAGGGYDFGPLLGLGSHRLVLGYNLFYLDYAREDTRYFSPRNFLVQGVSLGWRWGFSKAGVVGVETAGSQNDAGDLGGSAGGYLAVPLGSHLQLETRTRYFDNTVYRTLTSSVQCNVRF
ncbi:MAG: tetratricopeptide repeat protein [Candidatus Krumholzibacteriia bacterium]